MRTFVSMLEIIIGWFVIFTILIKMIEGGLMIEVKNFVEDIRRRFELW